MGPDLAAVVSVLGDAAEYPAEGFSQTARAMLVGGLAHALPGAGPATGEIHAFQGEFQKYAGDGLAATKSTALGVVQAMLEQIRTAEAQMGAAGEKHEAALKALGEARAEIEAKQEGHRQKSLDFKAAEAEHAKASKAAAKLSEQRRELEEKKGAVDAILADLRKFEAAEEMTGFDAGAVAQYLVDAGAEKALTAAACPALQVPKPARSEFDALIWAEALRIVEGGAAKAGTELAAVAATATCAESEALGLWAISDEAGEEAIGFEVALGDAARAEKRASGAVSAAEAEARKRKGEAAALDESRALFEGKVRKIDEAHAALERLRCPPQEPVAPSPAKPQEEAPSQPVAPSPAKPQEEAPQPAAPSPAKPGAA